MTEIEPPTVGVLPTAIRPEPAGASRSPASPPANDAMPEAKSLDHEGELARQLAEILRKPVKRTSPPQSAPVEPTDRNTEAALEVIEATPVTEVAASNPRELRRLHVRRTSDSPRQAAGDADNGAERPVEDGAAEPDGAALPLQASAWIEAARRERAYAILKGAAGWTISVATSVAIIAVAAWILLGRPMDLEAWLEQARKVLDLG